MSETIKEVELAKIRPNRLNPRPEINVERLNELADSIKEVGLLEPIIVRPKMHACEPHVITYLCSKA